MTDMWELAAFVENNPGDHPQRWRLAKKLYSEREYRLALEHLLVLHNDWTPKLNIERYLAATYYRLGRYAEAEEYLRKTIKQWPDEVGPLEQLAHVLQVDGQLDESLRMWKETLRLEPDHAIAEKSVRKIEAAMIEKDTVSGVSSVKNFQPEISAEYEDELLVPGTVCTQCGAQNSEEFETCWQCGGNLRKQSPSFMNTPPIEAHGPYLLRPETTTTLVLVSIGVLLLGVLALGVRLFLIYSNESNLPIFSVEDIGRKILVPARLAAGITMLLLWPFALKIALKLFQTRSSPPDMLVYIAGLLLGSLTFLLLLLPMPFPLFSFLLSLILSLGIIIISFRIRPAHTFAVWISHFLFVWLIACLAFWLVECRRYAEFINPLVELPAVSAAILGSNALPDAHAVKLPESVCPFRQKVRWKSSGSPWLDVNASTIEVKIKPESVSPGLRFQIYQGQELRYHENIQTQQERFVRVAIVPEQDYEIVLLGADNTIVPITLQSFLPFDFLN